MRKLHTSEGVDRRTVLSAMAGTGMVGLAGCAADEQNSGGTETATPESSTPTPGEETTTSTPADGESEEFRVAVTDNVHGIIGNTASTLGSILDLVQNNGVPYFAATSSDDLVPFSGEYVFVTFPSDLLAESPLILYG